MKVVMLNQTLPSDMLRKSIKAILFLATAILMILPGCGGGTRGTGDSQPTLSGYLRSTVGSPIASAQITQLETGNSTQSDSKGFFSFPVSVETNSLTIMVAGENFETSKQITNLDATQSQIELVITIDVDQGIIASVELGDISTGPTASPSTTPKPTVQSEDNKEYSQKISGTVVGRNGSKLSGAKISFSGTSKSDNTDSNGRFSLSTRAKSRSLILSVKYQGLRGSLRINGLPTDRDSSIELKIKLSIETSQPGDPIPDSPKLSLELGSIRIR